MLTAMFSGRHPCSKDKDGRFFIDADGEIFCHILNYLRFNRLPSGDVALLVFEQACYFGLQPLISDLESYSSVQLEKCLEKIRAAYPWYRDIIKLPVEQLKHKQLGQVIVPVTIGIRNHYGASVMCGNCSQMVRKAVADDPRGNALEYLIRHELQKRGFDMSKVTTTTVNCSSNVQQQAMYMYGASTYGQCGTGIRSIVIGF